ncbi:uncharacterized protein LOC118195901, partial [Stegodyphus dumicola]|uniref:uncharacterized protein LOC118195901 n=1 Tax=Stegodyphus dumicola TaxID=202533 RepID=UPI0015ADE560
MESRASHPSRNEGETHVSGKEETLRKTHNNVRGMVEQECSSEAIVNVTGRDSEKKVEECASNRGHNEKDNKRNGAQENSICDENMIQPKESEKDIRPVAFSQDQAEKDIKQTDEQGNFVPINIIIEERESNNGKSSSSDINTDEAERIISGKEKTPKKAEGNLQGMDEKKNRSATILNMTEKDAEKDINVGASTQDHSEERIKQTEEQGTRDSEQNGAQENSISGENMIESIESYIVQSSPSDLCIMKSETDGAGKEELSRKAHCNITVRYEENCPSESIVDVRKVSEKALRPAASSEGHTEKDIKQNDEQGNSVPNNIRIEQRKNNYGESSSSELDTDESERNIAGKEETLIKADGNLQGINAKTNRSETILNGVGKVSEKDMNVGVSTQDYSEKDIKQTEKRGILVPDGNINEQRESNKSELSASDPNTNEAERDDAGEEKTSMKIDENPQKKVQKERSETNANGVGKCSENDINLGVSTQEHCEKDIKQTVDHRNLIPDDNIIAKIECKNRELGSSDPISNEAERDVAEEEKISIKIDENIQGMDEKTNRSETLANGAGKDSKKVINLGASPQDQREKDIKQNEEQGNLGPDDNIIEQRESINSESSLSDPSTNVHIIEPKQCDNGESRPSTNEAKENFEGKEKASEKGVKSLKETEMKENPLSCHSVHMRKIFRKKYPPKERNFDSKRNFRRALKDKKCERDILLVSGTEACKRAVELNMCSAYCAGASKSTEAQLESDTSNQMSSEIEKNIHVENVQIKSENEKCSPAQQCIFEQEGNTDTEKHLPKSFHSSPCRKRDFQQHINVTVSVNIIKKFMPSVCEEKDSEENEVTEVKRISVDKHISNMGEDMPSLYAEDTTERKRISDSVLNMGGVKADSDINVDVSNTDDQQCERNLIKYEWKSDQLDQSASNTKEVSEASGSQDMQTKGMSEQFMESFPIEHDKKKENT